MTTNNEYLKTIAEKVTETEISGTHTDNYYLKLICTTYGYTYTGTVCDGKLIKDFASYITNKTYNKIHFDNKYYHDIAEELTEPINEQHFDNYYLGIIAENITPPTPVKTLDHIGVELIAGSQILSYADEQQTPDSQYATVRFTAYDEEDTVIPNLDLDFKVGSGAVTTVTTDSNGRYEYTYHSIGVGDVEISASKTVEGSLVSKTYEVEDCNYYSDFNADDGNWVKVNSNPTFFNSILSLPNLSGSTQGYYILNQVLNIPYSVELGFVDSGSSFPLRVSWYDGTTRKAEGTYSKSGRNYWGVISKGSEPNPSTGDIFTLEIDETEVQSYRNNNIISTTNYSLLGYKFGFNHDSNIAQKWDYIKIKPL